MSLIFLPEWMQYANYPGLELWKFLNLAIFITAGVFILRKPITNALSARREGIRRQLRSAEEERDRAAAKLAEAEALLAHLDGDVETVRKQALQEADLERQRQAAATASEMEKLKSQAARELETAQKTARKGLQQFLADRSIELARRSVLNQLRPEDDMRLIRERLSDLRRAKG
jgi:F-type H+-transporting ATPase subunit b